MGQNLPPAALIAVLVIYGAATLGRVPASVTDDDGCYASASYRFWQTGKPGVPGYREAAGLGRDVWAFGRTAAAIEGIFLHFAGVSVFAALLPSFLAGIALLGVVVMLGRTLWDVQTGLLAAALLSASGKFFEASRWARPDMLLALAFLTSLWLAARGRLLLAGLLIGWAGDIHLNGFLIAPIPLLFWLVLEPKKRRRSVVHFAGGALVGFVFWLTLHYWPDPAGMLRQAAVYGGSTHGVKITRGPLVALGEEIRRYTDWFWAARGHRHLLEGLLVAAAGAWMWAHEGRPGRALVGAWIAFFLIAALFMSNPFGWYLILVWPLFALWMARAFLAFPRRRLAWAALACLIAAYLANLALWAWKARQDTPMRAQIETLRELAPRDAPVLANGMFWFAFWDRDFTDDWYIKLRKFETQIDPRSGPTGWIEEQRKLGWRYVVASGELRLLLDPAVPLAEVLSAPTHRGREDEIRSARAFSVERTSIERRMSDTLVLRVQTDGMDVAR